MKTTVLAALVIMMSGSSSLFADNLEWGGTITQAWSGFGTSPYTATDTSVSPNQGISLFCLDFNDEIAPPTAWTANIYSLTSGNVANAAQYGGSYNSQLTTAFNSPDPKAPGETSAPQVSLNSTLSSPTASYTSYLEAAWLFTDIQQAILNHDANTEIVAQVAAWELFVNNSKSAQLTTDINTTSGSFTFSNYLSWSGGGYTNPGTNSTTTSTAGSFATEVSAAIAEAQSAVANNWGPGSNDYGSWSLVTGTPGYVVGYGSAVQEFLTPNGVPDFSPTPEPGSIVLLGTVIFGICWATRRRFKGHRAHRDHVHG